MRRHRTTIRFALVILLAASAAYYALVRPFRLIRGLDAQYQAVRHDAGRAEVQSIMGGPGTPGEAPYRAYWFDAALPESESRRIDSAIRYPVRTFFLPVTFEFTFDRDGRLVGKHRYD
jgi:hypothetical protein